MGSWRAFFWLAGHWLRRRILAAVPVALIAGLGVTGSFVALAAADRTWNAYPDYVERSDAGDLVINPSLATEDIDDVIRALPGVERITSEAMFTVSLDEGEPRTRYEVEVASSSLIVYGSSDGRYVDMDRPAVRNGRVAVGPNEAMLTGDAAERTGLRVGDSVPLAFWASGTDDSFAYDPDDAAFEEYMSEVVEPIGVERVEIVGIVTMADEVLPDDLYPRGDLIVSPDIAARYDCVPRVPGPGAAPEDFYEAITAPDCAVAYRYYSMAMRGGVSAVKPVLDEFLREAAVLNESLAAIPVDATYFMVPTETGRQIAAVERAIRPTVAALLVLGLASAAITVAVVGLLALRELRGTVTDQRQWRQLGLGSKPAAFVAWVPLAAAILAGVAVAAVAGWLLDTGPVGLVGAVEPNADRRLNSAALVAAGATGLAALVIVGLLSAMATRRHGAQAAGSAAAAKIRRLARSTGSPAVADGLRAAYGRRSAVPVVATCATLAGTFVAATVFGASFSRLLATPESYGWSWDLAAITGAGYGDLDMDAASEVLQQDPDVESWTALAVVNEVSLDNQPMATMIGFERESDLALPVLEGALPTKSDEVAIGATTASDLDLRVGDAVTVGGGFQPLDATVTGIVVFPALGPWFADRVGAGTGLLVPQALFEEAARRLDLGLGDIRTMASFVGVELREGADTPATRSRLEDHLSGLDLYGAPVFLYPEAVKPPEILDARSTLAVPVAVGAVFAITVALGLAFASWSSVRSRRRDLAILRALGFCGRQIRRSVRVHSSATMLAALVFGLPLGVIAGRWLWRSFADELGVMPDPANPWSLLALAVVGGLLLAVIAAEWPARIAARGKPADGLRAE